MASKKEIVDSLTQCGTLSYSKMIEFINSVFFSDGSTVEVESLAPESDTDFFEN